MPFAFSSAAVYPILMLLASNVFMTFAWYGHLKHKGSAIWIAIITSWGIAFFEYCLAVPANRIGSEVYSTAQLKTIQEVITLLVFSGFSVFWLGENLTWNHAIGFALIAVGASFIFRG
ncbi:DMT family protein [Rhizobium sp. CSW-27]|uniref:DMT family protein n=1 Tax=Rhizobium sp. CSW-27 TaxID=2839985 RepID=UPI001C01FEF1|nr:DMT family protein [Rhizobium sp. CSW-27]MBT9369390.1 DMT family protein [Rhizobium sp. CSW-27]